MIGSAVYEALDSFINHSQTYDYVYAHFPVSQDETAAMGIHHVGVL